MSELWNNDLFPINERLEIAIGAIHFRDGQIKNLQEQLRDALQSAESYKAAAEMRTVPDYENVLCHLYACLSEAKRRGAMYPQTSDEQERDSDAVHRTADLISWYGERGYPTKEQIEEKRNVRAGNRAPLPQPPENKHA